MCGLYDHAVVYVEYPEFIGEPGWGWAGGAVLVENLVDGQGNVFPDLEGYLLVLWEYQDLCDGAVFYRDRRALSRLGSWKGRLGVLGRRHGLSGGEGWGLEGGGTGGGL